MNNLGAYEDLLKIYSEDIQQNTKLVVALTVFIVINLIVTILNIVSQHVLKTKDKKIFSFTIREKKRVEHFENVYQKFDRLTFYNGRQDNDEFLNEVQDLMQFITKNKLYFKKKERDLMIEYADYFKTVLSDFRKKDLQLELSYSDKLEKAFNK